MATPTKKSPQMENLISKLFNVSRTQTIIDGKCTCCDGPATKFDSPLSEREYSISGLCQECQNGVFDA